MKSTEIVTSFLRDVESDKILILRRSSKVRSMKMLWAGISGIIEKGEKPLTRAKIEIFEEVGIAECDIRLVRTGDAMHIISPQYRNHMWRVYSFLFETRSPEITLNWENSEYRWIDTDELDSYDTVPDLEKVLLCLL